MEFTLEQSLKLALEGQCDDAPPCLEALEAQLGPCIRSNKDIDAVVASAGRNEELSQKVAIDVASCIVDEDGNPYFFAGLDNIEYAGDQPDTAAAPATVIPR